MVLSELPELVCIGGCDAGNLCMGQLSLRGGTLVPDLEALEVNEKALIEVGGSQRYEWSVAAGSCFTDSVSAAASRCHEAEFLLGTLDICY